MDVLASFTDVQLTCLLHQSPLEGDKYLLLDSPK